MTHSVSTVLFRRQFCVYCENNMTHSVSTDQFLSVLKYVVNLITTRFWRVIFLIQIEHNHYLDVTHGSSIQEMHLIS